MRGVGVAAGMLGEPGAASTCGLWLALLTGDLVGDLVRMGGSASVLAPSLHRCWPSMPVRPLSCAAGR